MTEIDTLGNCAPGEGDDKSTVQGLFVKEVKTTEDGVEVLMELRDETINDTDSKPERPGPGGLIAGGG